MKSKEPASLSQLKKNLDHALEAYVEALAAEKARQTSGPEQQSQTSTQSESNSDQINSESKETKENAAALIQGQELTETETAQSDQTSPQSETSDFDPSEDIFENLIMTIESLQARRGRSTSGLTSKLDALRDLAGTDSNKELDRIETQLESHVKTGRELVVKMEELTQLLQSDDQPDLFELYHSLEMDLERLFDESPVSSGSGEMSSLYQLLERVKSQHPIHN